jgi:phage-related protein
MELVVLKQAVRELKDCPKEIKLNIYSLLEEILNGKSLQMPISRSLYSIHKGLHELRLSSRSGEYRVFYYIKVNESVYVLHAADKKKQTIDQRTIELLIKRIKGI